MSEEAKPKACPWCQQIPQLIFRDDGRIGWRGNCPACESDKTASPEVMYRAIESWNNRPLEDALAAERDAALARVERLEAALQPLAALWRDGMERDPDSKTLWDHPDITVGDIRRARRELGEE